MTTRESDIFYMQCMVFRLAQEKWKLTGELCSKIFSEHHVMEFLSDCYDILHIGSYECILADLEEMLANKGVNLEKII